MAYGMLQDFISYLHLDKHELFATQCFIFLNLLFAVVLMVLILRYFKHDSLSIYSFYQNSSNELFSETDRIKKMLKDLNKMTNELNKVITHTNASIEARKQIIEVLQLKINSLSNEENSLNEKINTLNFLRNKQIVVSDIINDYFKKNNKNIILFNVFIGFVFCVLGSVFGYVLSKVF